MTTTLAILRSHSPAPARARRCASAACSPAPARGADSQLDVTQGNVAAAADRDPGFRRRHAGRYRCGARHHQVITANLQRSGLFAPIDPAAFIEKITNFDTPPRFADWKAINAQALVTGRVTRQGDGRLRVEFRLWDVFAGQQLTASSTSPAPDNWRRVAHIIADAIYERLTGEKGYFDTRIVFIDETGPKEQARQAPRHHGPGRRQCALSDRRRRPRADAALLADSTQEITYMSYGRASRASTCSTSRPGSARCVGNFPGMTFAPRFSPDGQQVIMSLQQGGNSNIFAMDLQSKRTTRLTDDRGDRHRAVLLAGRQPDRASNSDRGGAPQIYVMGADGSDREAHHASATGVYSTPVWSPRGDFIAFTKQAGGQFQIGVMRPDGSGERMLTSGYPQRGSDLGAERPRADVLPRAGRRRRAARSIRSTSPAATSRRSRRRASRRTRPGRRCCREVPAQFRK